MADPIYNIWIRGLDVDGADQLNNKLKRIRLVTVYSKLEFKIVYNNVGGWTLSMPGDTDEANTLKALLIGTPADDTATGQGFGGIIVTRNGEIVFSGPVRGFTETGDYTGPTGKSIEFWGVDDNGYLNSRIPMAPAAATNGNPATNTGVPFITGSLTTRYFVAPFFNNWAYYVYPDPADPRTVTQVISNFILPNMGASAPFNIGGGFQNRRIPFLDVPPQTFGPTTYRSRSRYAGTLLEKVQDAAAYVDGTYVGIYPGPYRGVAFRMFQTTTDRLSFEMWDPRDPNHNKGVVFSTGRGNLGSYKYSHQAPTTNFSVVGGQADNPETNRRGTTRWFEHAAANIIGSANTLGRYGLWEGYIDRRDIQYEGALITTPPNANFTNMRNELINAMKVHLREEGEQINIEVTAINVPPTVWPDDYNVGDIVKVVIGDYQYNDIVRDITVTLTKAEGEVVVPTIGSESTGISVGLFEKFNDIDTSVNNLNSSQ